MSIADRHVETPAKFDYGSRPRSDIRGVVWHMAEGNNVAAYLSRNPARGVSVHYTVEADGEIVSMLAENRIAGSVNPKTIRLTDDAYYGASHARYVLRDLWMNPNRGLIAVEVAGKARVGPNPKQVARMVALFEDCLKRYPDLKPIGHRDLQDVKPCPGNTPAMKLAFTGMGGHGKDYRKEAPRLVSTVGYVPDQYATLKPGANLYQYVGDTPFAQASAPLERLLLGKTPDGKYGLVVADSPADTNTAFDRTLFVATSDIKSTRIVPPVLPNADQIVKDARKGALAQAVAAVQAIPA